MQDADTLKTDHGVLLAAVREAGALGLAMAKAGFETWSKPDGSIVTSADLAIDGLMKERLLGHQQHYGWLSEETPDSAARLSKRSMWIVDPIDGTRAFSEGRDEWCVTAGLVIDGKATIAAVYRPMLDVMYWAISGQGSFRNSTRTTVRDGEDLVGSQIIGTKKSMEKLLVIGAMAITNLQIPLLLRLAMVGSGEIDGAVSVGYKNDWDLAAGVLLVEEGGGRVSDSLGKPMIFNLMPPKQNGMVAAGPHRHQKIMEHLTA